MIMFFFQAEDGIRDIGVTGVQTCALPIYDAVETIRGALAALKPGDDSGRVQLQLQLAEVYEDAARYDEAVSIYEDFLKARNIKDTPLANARDRQFAVDVLATIAGLRQKAGKTEEALATFERMQIGRAHV